MTELEKRYNFEQIQARCRLKWEHLEVYKFNTKDNNIFSIDTPPPTISGSLHIGHIFSYCHIDFIARYQRMSGKNVFYPCGFDNNGLPTERLVEKKHKIKANKTNKQTFLNLCDEACQEKTKEFKSLFDEIAFSFDWNLQYSTNDKRCQYISQDSFLELYKNGMLYRKCAPMFWDVVDQTAIAQAEVEEKEFESYMNYIKFKIEDDNQDFTVATTRPELLPACVAVFFNPEDNRYSKLQGKFAIVPIFNQKVPIIADEDVLMEKGTGLVMCCTFGDEMDVKWWQKHNLPITLAIDKYGKMEAFSGQKVEEARITCLKQLESGGFLIKQEKITHNVKCAERSGAKLEIIPTQQWYINILQHKEGILKKAREINWLPQKMRIKIEQWIEGIKWDWCISRQRYFGVPIPVWYNKNTGEIITPSKQDLPIDPKNTLPLGFSAEDLIPDEDVLDTWATSSLTPQINNVLISKEKFNTIDLRPQAHEIIRTWAFYTILKTFLTNKDTLPWKNIMISGWCLAHDKTKMSKSKENTVDPINLLKNYGADVVRYWAASASLGSDTCYSENVFLIGKKLINKIWNASKFVGQFVIKDFNIDNITYPTDVWIIDELFNLVEKVKESFENYDYCTAKSSIERFFLHEYCDNYVELVKARVYGNLPEQNSAVHALSLSLNIILKLFSPFFPYITEEIYGELFDASISVHAKGNWPVCNKPQSDTKTLLYELFFILSKIREFKSEKRMPLNATIKRIKIITAHRLLQFAGADIQSAGCSLELKWEFKEFVDTSVEIVA